MNHHTNSFESPAAAQHATLETLQQTLDSDHDGLARFGIVDPDVWSVELDDGHTLTLVDESVQPGGAFKYISSAASVATVPAGTTEVVTQTAGNFGMTLGEAASRGGLKARAFTPYDLNPSKHAGMEATGMAVVLAADTVELAAGPAREYVAGMAGAVLLHPYNNPWGVAGLRYMGDHVSAALRKLDANGGLDLERPTSVMIGLGGGGGVTGIASKFRSQKDSGELPEHLAVQAVRPQRVGHGEMNPRFDGLRVALPGNTNAPFLEDRRFTTATAVVDEASVADATRLVERLSPSVQYEPNALIAVGAITRWLANNPTAKPHNFVAVLTGRNVDPANYQYFRQLPGYAGSGTLQAKLAANQRRSEAMAATERAHQYTVRHSLGASSLLRTIDLERRGTSVYSAPTARYRTGLVTPRRP